jgi:hypothetical protein
MANTSKENTQSKLLKVNAESKVGIRKLLHFFRGIEESALSTSTHWSTRTRVSLPLGHLKNQVITMRCSFASPVWWIPHNCVQSPSQVTTKSSMVITELQSPPSHLGDADH